MKDILDLAVSSTATHHVKNAAGVEQYLNGDREKPVQIVLFGPSTSQYAAVEARQTARALRRREDNDGKLSAPSPEQRLAETAEDLSELTASFNNLPYSPAGEKTGRELFHALYSDIRLGFIVNQVSKVVSDWGKFASA